ncbi:MAG: type II secretion system F family protein [Candidimonas sp.]|nr:MAG: type II secretion system F family protein [Candidimonas sp.]TAM26301.1 MAG: type II secretion system F family protein [Candidimonas sp.]TAM75121.1 MAG: type II secretion system F family protein [Candidimonas sp.]
MWFWISCLAAGGSLCLFSWVLTRPLRLPSQPAKAYSSHIGIQIIWPWVAVFATASQPFIPWAMRQALRKKIQKAGLDPVWRAEHIVAMQALAFSCGAASAGLLIWGYSLLALTHGAAAALGFGGLCLWWPRRWLTQAGRVRQRQMLKEFPFLLDMATLCVEAGLNLQGALQQAAANGPPGALRYELRHALADMRAGMTRLDALQSLADRTDMPAIRQLVTALGQADQLGMSLGPLLRAQSEQRRAERFLRAEKLALEAPVKMLFPMIFCIFPCTFLIIGFPIAIKLIGVEF